MAVKFGLFVPQGWKMDLVEIRDPVAQFEAMAAVARAADAGPWDGIWVYDHFHTVPEPALETTFEAWTVTAAMARETKRVRLGQMVTCNGYRNPALYAKIASTVDAVSGGRLNAGIGAGWYEHEWRAYGYGFPETRERMQRFREAVEVIYRMWTEDRPVFHGRHYTIDGPINEPKSVQKPHIPLWIGGGGEQVTLKLVAQYGDACNVGRQAESVRRKLEVLKRHCDALGRNYDEIVKSAEADVFIIEPGDDPVAATARARGVWTYEQFTNWTVVGTEEEIRAHIQGLVDVGIDYVIVYLAGVAYDHAPLHRFEERIMPAFA